MKQFLSVFLLSCFYTISSAQIADDKLKHFGAGVAIGGIGALAANKLFNGDRYWTWSMAVGSSLAAGLAKEGYDKSNGNSWENSDILYTALGGIVSGLAFELFVNRKQCRRKGRPCSCYAVHIEKPLILNPGISLDLSGKGSHHLASEMQAQHMANSSLLVNFMGYTAPRPDHEK